MESNAKVFDVSYEHLQKQQAPTPQQLQQSLLFAVITHSTKQQSKLYFTGNT